MSAFDRPTEKEIRKQRGERTYLADLVLFSCGNTVDRVIVRQKPYNIINGLKKSYERTNPSWKGLLKTVSFMEKRKLNLEY